MVCPARMTPRYVVVSEDVGGAHVRGMQVSQSPPNCPWQLYASLPGRKLTLFVTSNFGRRAVERIGQAILQAASRHPAPQD